jgi:drug/metabolite transporter (DMT)-like permease
VLWLPYVLLSTLGWSSVNVLDSLLVRNYEKSPAILMWSQSLFSVIALLVLAAAFDVRTEWWPLLVAMGLSSYLADLYFFWVLHRVDVSVLNGGWAMLGLLLSAAGFVFFHESWNATQTAGAMLIMGGVLFLSFHNPSSGSLRKTLLLLFVMALLYAPSYVVKKAALDGGQGVLPVFFWLIIGRETLAFLFPWCVPSYRRRIRHLVRVADRKFFLIGGAVIASFLLGEYMGAMAFQNGPLSLVSVTSNIQPFVVIALAALLARFVPSHAPKEVLTAWSVRMKLVSFAVVFGGLALLALPK